MSLWHEDYFRLILRSGLRKTFISSPLLSKDNLGKGPGPGTVPSPEISAENMKLGLRGAGRGGLTAMETGAISVSHCPRMARQTCLYQAFFFFLSLCPWPAFPGQSQTPTRFPSLRGVYKPQLPDHLWAPIFLWSPHMYKTKFNFSC